MFRALGIILTALLAAALLLCSGEVTEITARAILLSVDNMVVSGWSLGQAEHPGTGPGKWGHRQAN